MNVRATISTAKLWFLEKLCGIGRFRLSSVLIAVLAASAFGEDLEIVRCEPGVRGGKLVAAQKSEAKSLNPVTALDTPSREVIRRTMADLISIDRISHNTVPSLAKSWTASKDGSKYTLALRRGLRFSDGHPFDADDVLFTFQAYLDEKVHSPQRDLLIINGRPIEVRKLDAYTVEFDLHSPYAAAERIFDSLAILPRHLLEKSWREGKLQEAWTLRTPANQFAGLGPFRVKEVRPGERIILERNPYYWRTDSKGTRLPYYDELHFVPAAGDDAQLMRFAGGETDILNRFSPRNGSMNILRDKPLHTVDLGPSLEYNFLFFNLNPAGEHYRWFGDVRFRQAISLAIDRKLMVAITHENYAAPLWGNVSPGNKQWVNTRLPHPEKNPARARELLTQAGFRWTADGKLADQQGKPVEFSIAASTSSRERVMMAVMIQEDLKQLGIPVQVAELEFRSLVDRVTNTRKYDACILGLGNGDADPNAEMNVWLSTGPTHLWNPEQKTPATPWEAEIDRLMKLQLTTMDRTRRKALYDRVQQIVAEQLPIIPLTSPNVFVAVRDHVGNFRPSVLDHYTLWNVEQLFDRRLSSRR